MLYGSSWYNSQSRSDFIETTCLICIPSVRMTQFKRKPLLARSVPGRPHCCARRPAEWPGSVSSSCQPLSCPLQADLYLPDRLNAFSPVATKRTDAMHNPLKAVSAQHVCQLASICEAARQEMSQFELLLLRQIARAWRPGLRSSAKGPHALPAEVRLPAAASSLVTRGDQNVFPWPELPPILPKGAQMNSGNLE